ncbi:MAG TPA: hypothetical protein VHT96_16150 [Clostridia bacterium]|nr:hypothetical protein [Clostridia bacterium]
MRKLIIIVSILSLILLFAACSDVKSTGVSNTNETGTNGSQISENTNMAEPVNTQAVKNSGTTEPAITAEPTSTAKPAGARLPKAEAVLKAKIIQLNEKSMLIAGTDAADLYTVTSTDAIFDAGNKSADASALKPGQNVEIGYSGAILESYPAQLGKPIYIKITDQGDDMVGFYKTVLNDLWNVDNGLNSDISVLAFDLSKVTNLNDAEKSALVYVVSGSHSLQGIMGTFDELREQGYIDKDKLYFETGILFKLELTDVTKNSFSFKAEKWRSGLGAYYFLDCRAVKNDAGWSYTIGHEAIS